MQDRSNMSERSRATLLKLCDLHPEFLSVSAVRFRVAEIAARSGISSQKRLAEEPWRHDPLRVGPPRGGNPLRAGPPYRPVPNPFPNNPYGDPRYPDFGAEPDPGTSGIFVSASHVLTLLAAQTTCSRRRLATTMTATSSRFPCIPANRFLACLIRVAVASAGDPASIHRRRRDSTRTLNATATPWGCRRVVASGACRRQGRLTRAVVDVLAGVGLVVRAIYKRAVAKWGAIVCVCV